MESETRQQTKPNVGATLLMVHAVITRGLEVARDSAEAQEGTPPGDARQGYADYLHSLASYLHGHHLTEDDLVFPYFKKIVPDAPYEKLSADHKTMEPNIRALDEGGDFWKSGDDARMAEIVAALDFLREMWYPHISIEEGFYDPEKLDKMLPTEEHVRLIPVLHGKLGARLSHRPVFPLQPAARPAGASGSGDATDSHGADGPCHLERHVGADEALPPRLKTGVMPILFGGPSLRMNGRQATAHEPSA